MHRFGNIAAPLLTCFTTLIATLYWADPQVVLEPTALLPALNTVFLACTPFFIVFISTKLFLAVGRLPLLMLGCGMLALGGAGAVSGWFIGQPGGPNTTVTIYNSGALLSGLLLLVSAVIPLLDVKETAPRLRLPLVLTSYLGVAVISASIAVAAVTGHAPDFIVQGAGPTSTGRVVLAAAIAFYAATAALSLRQYLGTRVEQLRWYATGLALFATGLAGVLLQKSVGSPIGWAGRTAQYTGGLCILVGVLTFWKTIISTGRPIAEAYGEVSRRRISELERQVAARTESLTAANARLRAEVEERMRAEDQILEHQKKMEALTQELSLTEERERERIAGELHDQVGQHLILVKLKLQWLANELTSEKEIVVAEEIDKLLSQSIQDIRSLTFQLRPPILANAGLGAAIKWLAEELRENYGLNFELTDDHTPLALRYEVRSSIFQAVREILLNVVKHSHCSLARIRLSSDAGRMQIEITDNGTGFDPDQVARKKSRSGGFGLFNLRKKIDYLGGEFRIETELGVGTRVFIVVPQDPVGSGDGTAADPVGAAESTAACPAGD
ncbi:sensor histidine kinase [Geomonas paludis]|uniref:Oxygen sensor histidine kinase NreB n=1 Tax=Geomonas paludis TaxID=2740185 RepID=A0A6V8MWM7_9BACT|nr:sensor histidine kinase [Geomonas paludis]GFO64481.1 hypothetical protein GMPD_24000 [Geomonas paludis]